MTVWNSGELTIVQRPDYMPLEYIIWKVIDAFKTRGIEATRISATSINIDDIPGNIGDDVEKAFEWLCGEGIVLQGVVEYYGDFEGGYVLENGVFEEYSKEALDVRCAETLDLEYELERRGARPVSYGRLLNIFQCYVNNDAEAAETGYVREALEKAGLSDDEFEGLGFGYLLDTEEVAE